MPSTSSLLIPRLYAAKLASSEIPHLRKSEAGFARAHRKARPFSIFAIGTCIAML